MSTAASNSRSLLESEAESARWVMRCDRGLTPAEQDQLSQWLASDPRHGRTFAEHRWGWEELDRLTGWPSPGAAPPDPDLLAPRLGSRLLGLRRLRWIVPVTLAVAATVVVALRLRESAHARTAPFLSTLDPALEERRVLDDGSVVQLRGGAEIFVAFTAGERRIQLLRGEAQFTVARDPGRPFIVSAARVEVQAVGTIFNLWLTAAEVEVLVFEGRVSVESVTDSRPSPHRLMLSAGACAIVSRAPAWSAQVTKLNPTQLVARRAGPPQRLHFNDATLAEVVAVLNQHNRVQLILGDLELGRLQLSGTFAADDLDGFVRLLAGVFAIKADRRSASEIVLQK